ncbi:MAG: TIGR03915 family putative DNA repair protein [Clostridia bacterium]|nr:TIGR03915 family putative DNA repair protein [Clostridia bacterium]
MVFLYDNTYEGFLTAVFAVYASKRHNEAYICPTDSNASLPLDAWVEVTSDSAQADRVVKRLIALELAEVVFDAWLSREEDIENHLLAVISLAIRENTTPMQRLWHPDVRVVAKAAGRVGNEAHRYLQFVRFVKVDSNRTMLTDGTDTPGLYVADIEPEYDILPKIASHFARRFQDQRFIIRDKTHAQALVYDTHSCQIVTFPELLAAPLPQDSEFAALWHSYFDAVAIPWRRNLKLQQQFVPLKYRRHMTEFQPQR